MTQSFNRRRFLKRTAAATSVVGASQLLTVPNILAERSPNSKLNIAGIGVGGRGGAHVDSAMAENLVAVCDVVEGTIDGCIRHVEKQYKDQGVDRPLPARFADYREMLEKMDGQIDAVFVATADHHHAPPRCWRWTWASTSTARSR